MKRTRELVRDAALTAAIVLALPLLGAAAGAAYGCAGAVACVWLTWRERGRGSVDGARDG